MNPEQIHLKGHPRLRRAAYQGAFVIEADEGEGRGWTYLKDAAMNTLAWRTEKNCDIQIESVAAQLRAAGKTVTIEPPV